MPAHKPGESIEGLEIKGHSRDPLRFLSTKKINGIKCFIFKAEFDVFAEIVAELADETPQIEIKLYLMPHINMELTYGDLNSVVTPRQEIMDALQKRYFNIQSNTVISGI